MPKVSHNEDATEPFYHGSFCSLSESSSVNDTDRRSTSSWSRIVPLVLGLTILALAGVGVYLFIDHRGLRSKSSSSLTEVSMEELALHDSPSDCYLALYGSVYDLTTYAPEHPGGPEYVTDFCGMDGTRDYSIEHPESLLKTVENLKVGVVVLTQEPTPLGRTATPVLLPTTAPTSDPTSGRTTAPTSGRTSNPRNTPTVVPTPEPSLVPTKAPTTSPTHQALPVSTETPTSLPTQVSSQELSLLTETPTSQAPDYREEDNEDDENEEDNEDDEDEESEDSSEYHALTGNPGVPSTSQFPTTTAPTKAPGLRATQDPAGPPTSAPTKVPAPVSTSGNPVPAPTFAPVMTPTFAPTRALTVAPTRAPTFAPTQRPTPRPTPRPTARPTRPPTDPPAVCIGASEVAQHNTRDDCWYILYNRVWDFTDYIDNHPGGARRVFEHCGTDATDPYQAENAHTERLLDREVPQYEIGTLC